MVWVKMKVSLLFGELQFAESWTDNAPAGTELTRDSFARHREELQGRRGRGMETSVSSVRENVETVIADIQAAKGLAKVRCDVMRLRFHLKLVAPIRPARTEVSFTSSKLPVKAYAGLCFHWPS